MHVSFKNNKNPSRGEEIHQEKVGCKTISIVSSSPTLQSQRYNHVIGIEDIYEYFKQIKTDCLKKVRQRGVLINVEGPKMNEPPYVSNEM